MHLYLIRIKIAVHDSMYLQLPTEISKIPSLFHPPPSLICSRSFCFCLAAEKMMESKDPAIKLFGRKIPVSIDEAPLVKGDDMRATSEEVEGGGGGGGGAEKDTAKVKATESIQVSDEAILDTEETVEDADDVSFEHGSMDEESARPENAENQKEPSDTDNSKDKTLKKPDKILPCPRCTSMDTKFCYYNNYNVNQPRHFCKACQRYWTAGGTMRNVPVGAGRRKNKNSSSHYRHISVSEALQAARIDASTGTHQHGLSTNGRFLSFGLDAPICDSMAPVLNLSEKKVLNGTKNGLQRFEEKGFPVLYKGGEIGDDCSSKSSISVSNSKEEGVRKCPQEPSMLNVNGFHTQIPCLPGVPWPYPWNSAVHPQAFCPPGVPLSFYPAAHWNCGLPGTWNVPWFPPQPFSPNESTSLGSNSPTLGKHSRDSDMMKADQLEIEEPPKQKNGCVLVPKTLRIDDPNEAAKSSIWATLGIKNDSISGGGLFKAFHSKGEEKNRIIETSPVLQANPAALSRSLNFHERS